MHIELEGEWDEHEIRAGLRAARPAWVWLMPVALVAGIAVLMLVDSGGDPGITEAVLLAILTAIVILAITVGVRRQIGKLIDVPSLGGPVQGAITDEALVVNARDSSSHAPWSQFKSMRFNDSAAALVTRQRTCLLVLRNWFPDDASWDAFTAAVPDRIARAGRGTADGSTGSADTRGRIDEANPETPAPEGVRFGGPFNPAEHRRIISRISAGRRYGIAVVVLGGLFVLLAVVASATGSSSDTLLPTGIITVVLGLLVLYGLPALSTRMAGRGTKAGGVTGTADDTGIVMIFRDGRSTVNWSAFIKVIRTDRAVGLMMTDQAAVIVGRSWFESDGDWQRFLTLVERHVNR